MAQMTTRNGSWSGALLAGALLLLAGCDDADQLAADDRRFALAASTSSVCPYVEPSNDGTDDTAGSLGVTAQVAGTVFGDDGSVVPDVKVKFETTEGELREPGADVGGPTLVLRTDSRGQALANVFIDQRPPDDEIVVNASVPGGDRDDEVTIAAPAAPSPIFLAQPGTLTLGTSSDKTTLIFGVNSPGCGIYKVEAQVTYDASKLKFSETQFPEDVSILEFPPLGTADVPVEYTATPAVPNGSVLVRAQRVNSPLTGTNRSGNYLQVSFEAIAAGEAEIRIHRLELFPVPLLGGPSWVFSPGSDEDLVFTITIKPEE
ncbi:MAG: hypothetical protein KBD01_14020 [Acidobacteria bacterium]|nr:hypothetical protein [Acidobacteriota bacterium]